MPHDKNGTLLQVGDLVTLLCCITQISPSETQCNVTAEAVERPEGEGYVPTIAGNSRFYEKVANVASPVSSLQPHQQRVVDEKAELDAKLEKLRAFFETPIFAGLSDLEKARLCAQSGAMSDYSAILGERIDAFTSTPSTPP